MLEGLACGDPLPARAFAEVKERAVREAFKWNITDGGSDRLADFPLFLSATLWRTLSRWAVSLANEAEAAEAELLRRPLLRCLLGIPRPLQLALRSTARAPSLRYSRFDFHPTVDGTFAITEGNLDVAGGWNEAGRVTALFAAAVEGAAPPGDPAGALARRLAQRLGGDRTVGIMHLTSYADDHQVARYLALAFEREGLDALHFDPTQLRAAGNRAGALVGEELRPLGAVFRFFPAEWSCRLAARGDWFAAAANPGTVWTNSLSAVLTQSKRFPLSWRYLSARLPTWSQLLPETRSPLLRRGSEWIVKPVLGHEGYQVGVAGATEPTRLRALWWRARRRPWRWVAQRSFRPRAIPTPHGTRFPCIGVYVVDGRPEGLYGRLARRPLIDAESQEVVVLVES
jgi:glutathionylspermidine synthase